MLLHQPNIITLNPANKKTDQSLSDIQTDIDTAVHATLYTDYLVSCTKTALVYTVASTGF